MIKIIDECYFIYIIIAIQIYKRKHIDKIIKYLTHHMVTGVIMMTQVTTGYISTWVDQVTQWF